MEKRLEDNRFERLFQKIKKRWLLCILSPFIFIITLEILCLGALYVNDVIIKKRSSKMFFSQYILTDIFISPFLPKPSSMLKGTYKQKYLGAVPYNSSLDREIFPGDSLMGWRSGKNLISLRHGKWLQVTNDEGFMSIGPFDFHYERKKQPGVFRLIVVGGSTVWGQGVETPDKNIPALINDLLGKARPSVKFEVINAGVGGYVSAQELLYLMSELVSYNPDMIIVYDGWNDENGNNDDIDRYGDSLNPLKTTTHYENEIMINKMYSSCQLAILLAGNIKRDILKLLKESGMNQLADRITGKLRLMRNEKEQEEKMAKPGYIPVYHPKSVRMYRENLERMILLAQYHGFKIATFLQPVMGVDNKPLSEEEKVIYSAYGEVHFAPDSVKRLFYRDARAFFAELKTGNSGKNACTEDLSQVFAGVTETVYVDPGHLNHNGNLIVAKNMVDSLLKCGIIDY